MFTIIHNKSHSKMIEYNIIKKGDYIFAVTDNGQEIAHLPMNGGERIVGLDYLPQLPFNRKTDSEIEESVWYREAIKSLNAQDSIRLSKCYGYLIEMAKLCLRIGYKSGNDIVIPKKFISKSRFINSQGINEMEGYYIFN